MIEKLEWDSKHFGINIANLDVKKFKGVFDDVDRFVKKEKIAIIQSCCDIADMKTISMLEAYGFNFSDLKITYVIDLKKQLVENVVPMKVSCDDLNILKKIAAKAFVGKSRFYRKPFKKEKADKLFQIWLEKSIYGEYDDICLKVEAKNIPAGFITGKSCDAENAHIGIIGVDETLRGEGVGTKLIRSLLAFYKNEGKKRVYVSTQGINFIANNFYIKNGFRISGIKAWYYKKCII